MRDISIRPYVRERDYQVVDQLLADLYRPNGALINWMRSSASAHSARRAHSEA